jgi:hypothetical protein
MAGATVRQVAVVFGDESRNRGAYDVLGALFMPRTNAERLRERIAIYRTMPPCPHPLMEVKWEKCTGKKPLPLFERIVDDVTSMFKTKRARYKCLVIERKLVKRFERGKDQRAESVSKSWKLLLGSSIKPARLYDVTLDNDAVRGDLQLATLKRVLNLAARNKEGFGDTTFPDVRMLDSKQDDLLQVVDLITGAVGYHWAGLHTVEGCSKAKCLLAERIAKGIGRPNLAFETPLSAYAFNVWRYRPRKDEDGAP